MISHLVGFRLKPSVMNSSCKRRISDVTISSSPPTVRSSKNPTARSASTDASKSLIVRQNNNGARGSPCCVPSSELTVYWPNASTEDDMYADSVKAYSSGTYLATASSILSLLRQLNALLISSLMQISSGLMFWRKRRTALTAISDPLGMPNPSCRGPSIAAHFEVTFLDATLALSLRITEPTAIGLNPPPFLLSARRLAPNSNGRMNVGELPINRKFTNSVIDAKKAIPVSPAAMS